MPIRDRIRSAHLLAALLFALCGVSANARAQVFLPGERPAEERLPTPEFEPEAQEGGPILPPYPIPQAPDERGLVGGVRLRVSEVHIEGNTAVSDETLQAIARAYEGRAVDYTELLELRDLLTLAYVERGYLTSGAVLPPQTIREGVVRFQILEGRLERIDVKSDGRFRPRYLRQRLRAADDRPVNIRDIEARLQLLQLDPRILRVRADLEPGAERGLSVLRVHVEETAWAHAELAFDNHRNPSIGELGGEFSFELDNLVGWADFYSGRATISAGLWQLEGRAGAPITPWDTLLTVRVRGSESVIVEEPIASLLQIESDAFSVGIELRQPLRRSPRHTIESFVRGDFRRSSTRIDGVGLSFAPGTQDGRSQLAVLRWGLEWSARGRRQALAARSLLSFGLDALGATRNPGGEPDARFIAWLAQAQWAGRLPARWLETELLARADLQLTNSALLPLEQIALGGRHTVRGYRENAIARDNGFVGSLEARVPVYRRVRPALSVELVPFLDLGHAWSHRSDGPGAQSLVSIGLGGRLAMQRLGYLEVYWGEPLIEAGGVDGSDLQASGLHIRLAVRLP